MCVCGEHLCIRAQKLHAEFTKKTAGPCNSIKKLSGRERESHSRLVKYLGLKLFISEGKQSKAKEKEAFCCLTVFQNIPLLMENSSRECG